MKGAFEETYPCLGITCAQVGALPGTTACTHTVPIAGYIPGSDVFQHNNIDLDQAAMESALGSRDFSGATNWYAVGGNSLSKGSYRTRVCGDGSRDEQSLVVLLSTCVQLWLC